MNILWLCMSTNSKAESILQNGTGSHQLQCILRLFKVDNMQFTNALHLTSAIQVHYPPNSPRLQVWCIQHLKTEESWTAIRSQRGSRKGARTAPIRCIAIKPASATWIWFWRCSSANRRKAARSTSLSWLRKWWLAIITMSKTFQELKEKHATKQTDKMTLIFSTKRLVNVQNKNTTSVTRQYYTHDIFSKRFWCIKVHSIQKSDIINLQFSTF